MNMRSRMLTSIFLGCLISVWGFAAHAQTPKTVPGDPMKTQIYTLDNGLKVYLSVNKQAPRVQTFIAVRVGGKNDPAETTGLAHYFEHIMFKGTQKFGTSDYAKEKVYLDQIEQLYEQHRATTDEDQKKQIYHQIDSVSYLASQYAIPNEYDKLMSAIGAQGTNAYTSYDQTVYVENIPANQVENWAKIQADRFENAVIRGFHTELESVYEEKNISLTKDSRKLYESLLNGIFPDHPYGTQTVLGTQYDLKNPSITNIKAYFKKYYVPNNMAICMAGDLDPDKTIAIIRKYFGHLTPNPELERSVLVKETYPTQIVEKKVYGQEAENLMIGWRIPGPKSPESEVAILVSAMLDNGKTGLIDKNLLLKQKVLMAGSGAMGLSDYDVFCLVGYPKQGQSLEQLRDLLLEQVTLLRKGQFDESLIPATISNYKLQFMKGLESNKSRADSFVHAFINQIPWERNVQLLDRLSKVTKSQIMDFANKYLVDNYCIAYKLQGEDKNAVKMEKPAITPIQMNRDKVSDFLKEIVSTEVDPIEPEFVDFAKELDISHSDAAQRDLIYRKNTINDIFNITYLFEPGLGDDKYFTLAGSYLDVLGTDSLSASAIKSAFYNIACDYNFNTSGRRVSLTISGLQENMDAAMKLVEHLFTRAQGDEAAFGRVKEDILLARENSQKSQGSNFSALINYMVNGEDYIRHNVATNEELAAVTSGEILDKIHKLLLYPHRVIFYGPAEKSNVLASLQAYHPTPAQQLQTPAEYKHQYNTTTEPKVYIAQYDAPNFNMLMFNNTGMKYDVTLLPEVRLFNSYFGDGMNSIVFQELREARGLAYSAGGSFSTPSRPERTFTIVSNIASQSDKLPSALDTFMEITNNMPKSEAAFKIAKDGIIASMRSARVHPSEYAFRYIALQDMGLSKDPSEEIYHKIHSLNLDDILDFQQKHVKGKTYHYGIVGDEKSLDMKYLEKVGPVTKVTKKEIFGY